jgi:hypothetical protein
VDGRGRREFIATSSVELSGANTIPVMTLDAIAAALNTSMVDLLRRALK